MRSYEAAYFLLPDLEEPAVQALNGKFIAQVTPTGGEPPKVDDQGKKRLAYPVKGRQEGRFFVLEFQGDPQMAQALNRLLRITDEVLRAMVVKLN